MTDTVNFSEFQTGRLLHKNGRFRALSTDADPTKGGSNILVQEAVSTDGVGGWVDRGGYNSLSDDYAYSNAREHVDRLAKRNSP